jgi:hypothetical protein
MVVPFGISAVSCTSSTEMTAKRNVPFRGRKLRPPQVTTCQSSGYTEPRRTTWGMNCLWNSESIP